MKIYSFYPQLSGCFPGFLLRISYTLYIYARARAGRKRVFSSAVPNYFALFKICRISFCFFSSGPKIPFVAFRLYF
jgi:hypothetical protein